MTSGIYTRDVSEKVASGLKFLIENASDKKFLELPLTRTKRTSGSERSESEDFVVSIRLIDDFPRITPRAQGGEIARCITSEGKRLDIIFGNPAERSLEPALVEIEE